MREVLAGSTTRIGCRAGGHTGSSTTCKPGCLSADKLHNTRHHLFARHGQDPTGLTKTDRFLRQAKSHYTLHTNHRWASQLIGTIVWCLEGTQDHAFESG